MGRVTTEAKVENLADLYAAKQGHRTVDQIRSVTIPDALVDTGATMLSLPSRLIEQLGLARVSTRRIVSSVGKAEAGIFEAVWLTIQGRSCSMDVLEVPDGVPALIGQIPLEQLDFVVDPQSRRLVGNPAHGGEHVIEMY